MTNTKIDWADSSWNPITGCYHNCEYCYARAIAHRFKGCNDTSLAKHVITENGKNVYELKAPLMRTGKSGKTTIAPYPFGFAPTLHKYRFDEIKGWHKPRNVFVGSMTDVFGDWVSDEWLSELFAACTEAEQHNFMFLTKNPDRYYDLALADKLPKKNNMWYGTTITTPDGKFWYSEDYNTFLSIEPLMSDFEANPDALRGIDWVIIGAETGTRKDKVVPAREWVEHIADACIQAHIPVFMKSSLLPVVGKNNMIQEFPEKLRMR